MSATLRVIDPFVIGLQFGRIQSPAALAIIERTPGALEDTPVRHELRYLQRWPIGTSYPRVVREFLEVFRQPLPVRQFNRDAMGHALSVSLEGQTTALVVNATGAGRAAIELLDDEAPDVRTVATWVTTGDQAVEDATGWRVPQRDLVAAVQVLQQQDRLAFAPGMPDYPELHAQMEAFHVIAGASGRDRYEPDAGDDLVVALALACWWGELMAPAHTEWVPGDFSAWSPEALKYEQEKRRIKSTAPKRGGPLADGIG